MTEVARTSGFEVPPTFQEVEVGESENIKCQTCNGEGKANIAGMKLDCMQCKGKGSWSDSRKRLEVGALAVDESNATLNVLVNEFEAVDTLTTSHKVDGLQELVAGVHLNTGIMSGRYLLELRTPQHESLTSALCTPKHLLRFGVSTVGSSPLLAGDSLDCAFFDSDGFFTHDKRNDKSCQPFGLGHVMGILINLESGPGSTSQTMSLFQDGRRASDPQALPEALRGKLLVPTITYKHVSVQLNFTREPWCPLSFRCSTLPDAVVTDIQQIPGPAEDVKHEVLFPIGLPDTGVFDWIDSCLALNPKYLELSDRKILEWASKSGLERKKGYTWKNSLDRPGLDLGITSFDNTSAQRSLMKTASELRRSFIVAELKANLIPEERKTLLAKFSDSRFTKVGVVLLGEPDDAHKAVVQKLLLRDKRKKAEDELLRSEVDGAMAKFKLEKAQKRMGRFTASAAISKETEPADEDTKRTDPDQVELSEDEKAAWQRLSKIPDLTPANLAAYGKFALPSEDEGFTEIRYAWQSKDKCAEIMHSYLLDKRLTTRLESLRPGESFNAEWSRWSKTLQEWRKLQAAWKGNGKDSPDAKDKRPLEVEDIAGVEDVKDVGNGEPLFAHFEYEDWVLLSLRYEMHILCHSFRQDCDDPGHPGIPEAHLSFYYNKYFEKSLDMKICNVATTKELFEIMGGAGADNSVRLNEDNSFLETVLPQSEHFDRFLKSIEEQRQDRKRCVEAGDESSQLTFVRPASVSTSLGKRARMPTGRSAPIGVSPALRSTGSGRIGALSRPVAGRGQLRQPGAARTGPGAPFRPAPGQLRPAGLLRPAGQQSTGEVGGRPMLRPALRQSRPAVGQSPTAAAPWSRPATAPPRLGPGAGARPSLAGARPALSSSAAGTTRLARPALKSSVTGTTRLARPALKQPAALSQPVGRVLPRRPATTGAIGRPAPSQGHSGYGDPQRSAAYPAPRVRPGYEAQRAPPGYGAPPPAGYGAPPKGYGAPPAQKRPAPSGYGAPPPSYGAPSPGYGAQKRPAPSSYGAPPSQRPRTSYNSPIGGGKGGGKGGSKGVDSRW